MTGIPAAIVSSIAVRPALGPGDLHEQVAALDHGVQPARLLNRGIGVMGQVRVDLERDPAVTKLALAVKHGLEQITGAPDVIARQREEDLLWIGLCGEHLAQLLVVGVARADRVLEDGRVRGHADDPVVDKSCQIAVANERAREVVDPRTLAVIEEGFEGIAHLDSNSLAFTPSGYPAGGASPRSGEASCTATSRAREASAAARRASGIPNHNARSRPRHDTTRIVPSRSHDIGDQDQDPGEPEREKHRAEDRQAVGGFDQVLLLPSDGTGSGAGSRAQSAGPRRLRRTAATAK